MLTERFLLEDILDILKHVSSKHKVAFIPQRTFRDNETLYNFYLYSSGDMHLDKTIFRRPHSVF